MCFIVIVPQVMNLIGFLIGYYLVGLYTYFGLK